MNKVARPAKKWKMYVIHHSHTDIGYTERQEKIEQFHVDFIRQAIETVNAIDAGEKEPWQGFKWTCETFWAVEQFWARATDELKGKFIAALKRGDIELSGTYLNMTELLDFDILSKNHLKASTFAKEHGVIMNSAMTADINGYSWGYAQSLIDAGVEHLLSCIHTHHGMYAAGRKQYPFYWETPKGDRLLVWNGEHYMLGNDLGLSPGAVLSYTIRDEFNGSALAENHWEMAENRIMRYFRQLEKEEYPYDFALVNVMGLLRDNAAPNGSIMDFMNEWNEKFGEFVEIEMTTLSHFFEQVKQQEHSIPVYKGDWPDWWTDGVASTAMHTQIFRDAQRTLRLVKQLDPNSNIVKQDVIDEAEHQLTMYAEHTWGYHSSVYEPWHPMVQSLAVRKESYAAVASRLVFTALDQVLHEQGEMLLSPGRPFRFKVINSFDHAVEDLAYMYLDGWEPPMFKSGIEVVDEQTSEVYAHQEDWVSRGFQIALPINLAPKEEKVFILRHAEHKEGATTRSNRLKGNDGVYDMEDLIDLVPEQKQGLLITENYIESPFVRIAWKEGKGIISWYDKQMNREMISEGSKHGAFTPVYEVTPVSGVSQMAEVRRKMGRNRKGIDVKRSSGRLSGIKEITNGKLYGVVELIYEIKGMSYFSLFLKVYIDSPRVDVSVRMHKDSVWEPENVYIALPLRTGADKEQLWMEKSGALIRPGIDQIPGTLIDYYSIQEGLAYIADDAGLSIATPDTPLVQVGPLAYGQRKVNGQQLEGEYDQLYAWVLTNYWETNFKATLGGYYEFRYRVQWGKEISSAEQAVQLSHSNNAGILCIRVKE
ncbi:glycoside hydrolase [Bacillus sp. FJAT-28004]|uniref:glycoside hydrolase family 38 N-terminal domain-containing protein n=1 Tax=Bacillus sp. FJAT-28004 TaxID=1679165 RepID=UPI0006B5565F|nr:glycoside hydrolase [Bacillus sp. FJAT-28004]